MHIQKLLAVICVSACVGTVAVKAQKPDTDIQARARALLHQREAELATGQTPATNVPPPAAPPAAAAVAPAPAPEPAPAPAPAPEPPAPVVQPPAPAPEPPAPAPVPAPAPPPAPEPVATVAPAPAPAPEPAVTVEPAPPAVTPAIPASSLSPEDQAKALEAVRRKIAELNGRSGKAAPAPISPSVVVTPPAVVTPAPVTIEPIPSQTPPGVFIPPADAKAQAAADAKAKREQARLAAKQAKEQEAAAREAAKEAKKREKMSPPGSPAQDAFAPAPTNMEPGSKQARLYDLLQRYRRDEITPTQYHAERAKIISEP